MRQYAGRTTYSLVFGDLGMSTSQQRPATSRVGLSPPAESCMSMCVGFPSRVYNHAVVHFVCISWWVVYCTLYVSDLEGILPSACNCSYKSCLHCFARLSEVHWKCAESGGRCGTGGTKGKSCSVLHSSAMLIYHASVLVLSWLAAQLQRWRSLAIKVQRARYADAAQADVETSASVSGAGHPPGSVRRKVQKHGLRPKIAG